MPPACSDVRKLRTERNGKIMTPLQMAGHLSLEFGAEVEGPFGEPGHISVRVWFPNKRGMSLIQRDGIEIPGTVQALVIRETIPVSDVECEGTPWRGDYSTPITNNVRGGMTIDDVREAVVTLRNLPAIDPRDQRSTRRNNV